MSLANLVNTPPAGPLSRGLWKRKRDSDDEDGEPESGTKMPRYSYHVTLESESPQPTDEDDESIYSVQGKETDYAKDTSDTSTDTWVSSCDSRDASLRAEYEVASLSEDEDPFPSATSTSDPDDIVTVGVIAAFCDSDLGLADDSNNSRSSVDSEIGRADYWTCVQCNATNNNPLFRYCEKCYQIRKNFFPPRPKWRRRRFRRKSANSARGQSEAKPQEMISLDSGLGSSQESKFSLNLDLKLDQIIVPGLDTPASSSKESVDSIGNEIQSQGFEVNSRSWKRMRSTEERFRNYIHEFKSKELMNNVDSEHGSSQESKFSLDMDLKLDQIIVPGLDTPASSSKESLDSIGNEIQSQEFEENSRRRKRMCSTEERFRSYGHEFKSEELINNVDSGLGSSQESKFSLDLDLNLNQKIVPGLDTTASSSKKSVDSIGNEIQSQEFELNSRSWKRMRSAAERFRSYGHEFKSEELINNVDSGLGSSQESKFSLDLDLNLNQIIVPGRDTMASSSKESVDSIGNEILNQEFEENSRRRKKMCSAKEPFRSYGHEFRSKELINNVDSGLCSSQESEFSLDLDLNLGEIIVPGQDTTASSSKKPMDTIHSIFPSSRASQCSVERQPRSNGILNQELNLDHIIKPGQETLKLDQIKKPGQGNPKMEPTLNPMTKPSQVSPELDLKLHEIIKHGQETRKFDPTLDHIVKPGQESPKADPTLNQVLKPGQETPRMDSIFVQITKPGQEEANLALEKFQCTRNTSDNAALSDLRSALCARKRSRTEPKSSKVDSSSVSSKASDLSALIEDSEGDEGCAGEKRQKMADDAQAEISEALRKAAESRARSDAEDKWCIVCTTAPRNGAFVHKGKIHCCCCYPCALKVWKKTKNCPICRRKVKNVHKIFYH